MKQNRNVTLPIELVTKRNKLSGYAPLQSRGASCSPSKAGYHRGVIDIDTTLWHIN